MSLSGRACCILCQRSEETKITGPLSTKEDVTAHQNCLLFSSGIFCSNTPQFDDLFGFSVQDVKVEVNRGRKLVCPWCKKRGGTSGCELRRCKKSFHYPCAIEEGARTFQDKRNEKYGLYCKNHREEENIDSAKGSNKLSKASKKSSEANPSKVVLSSLNKKKSNGTISDSSNTSLGSLKRRLSFTDQTEEQSSNRKTKKRNRTTSVDSSDSALAELIPPLESDLEESGSFLTQQQSPEPQFNSKDCEGPSVEYQVEIEYTDVKAEDATFTDSDAESDSLLQPFLNHISCPSDVKSPTQTVQADVHWVEKEVQTIKKELDDIPVQRPTYSPEVYASEPAVPEQNLSEPLLSPKPDEPQSPSSSSSMTMPLLKPICVTLLSSPPPSPPQAPVSNPPPSPPQAPFSNPSPSPPQAPFSNPSPSPPQALFSNPSPSPPQALFSNPPPSPPQAPSSDPAPIVDSASFWRNCNAASCTQTIFSEFINEVNELSSRILSDQASQEDYNRALSVTMASGKLAEFVSKQQEELHRKRAALQKEAEAMKDVVSALRK